MRRNIMWILSAAVILGAVYWIFVAPNSDDAPSSTDSTSQTTNKSASKSSGPKLIIGEPDAPKTIVEYGDYKCPNCNSFHTGSYVELKRDYLDTGKAKIEFRNLPYIAEDSRTAAEGTYCAAEQGLFEQYHNGVYDHISDVYAREGTGKEFDDILTASFLSGLIADAGGSVQKFSACLKDTKYKAEVDNDLKNSESDGATGTPTFFINGQKIVGAQPITAFRPLLEAN